MYIDSHCHLGFKDLGNHKEATLSIIKQAKECDVSHILNIATDVKDFCEYLDFALDVNNQKDIYPCILTAIGVHPLHINENPNFVDKDIINYLDNEKYKKNIVAIGETGFDAYYSNNKEDITKQIDFFNIHAAIATKNNLPIIIHSRNANEITIENLTNWVKNKNLKGVVHCFSGDIVFAKQILDLGFYISFSGVLTFKKAIDLHEVAKYVPKDFILSETDAPYLAPNPHRGKINKPDYVRHTTQFLANLRQESILETTQYIKNNFFNLFNKAI
jgi:TatD DNase family protein